MFVTSDMTPNLLSLAQESIMPYQLHNDDCVKVLKTYPDNYFDSIVADPPAGISFMGKDWDHDKGGRDAWIEWMTEVARECLRTLKPGAHAAIWALPRTSHWTATAWENAGFEVRDRISHVFGSGFPKSYNVSKGIEGILTNGSASWNEFHKLNGKKGAKNVRGSNGLVKLNQEHGNRPEQYESHGTLDLEPTTDEAKQWDGWGTALKPAMEDWWLFRKPISEKTVAANVLKWGTGALNVDACRIKTEESLTRLGKGLASANHEGWKRPWHDEAEEREWGSKDGRWPANFIHDGSDEVVELFPFQTSGELTGQPRLENKIYGSAGNTLGKPMFAKGSSGSAARFFYCAKPSKSERDEGLDGVEEIEVGHNRFDKCGICGGYLLQNKDRPSACKCENPERIPNKIKGNSHPTVKAQSLMKYLITLITPPGGIVLDCFMGSGSTGVAAVKLGFPFVGIDNDKKYGYFQIAEKRIKHAGLQERLF